MKCAIFVSRSTTTMMESYPRAVSGRPVIKSTDTESQAPFGMGKGWRSPPGFPDSGLLV